MFKSFESIVPADLHSMDLSFRKKMCSFGNVVPLNIKFTTPPLICGWTPKVQTFGSNKSCNMPLRVSDPEFEKWLQAMETEMTSVVQRLTESKKVVTLTKPPYRSGYDRLLFASLDIDECDTITTPMFDASGKIIRKVYEGNEMSLDITFSYIFLGHNGNVSVKTKVNKITVTKQ